MADSTVNGLVDGLTLAPTDLFYVSRSPHTAGYDRKLSAKQMAGLFSSGDAASRMLGSEFGIAFDFLARSACLRGEARAIEGRGWPEDFLTVSRASTATFVGRNRLLQTAAISALRYDHDPGTGEQLGILLEPAGTNLLIRPQELDNAAWIKTRMTATANAALAPDGTITADALVEDSTVASSHFIQSASVTIAPNTQHVASIFLRRGSGTRNVEMRFLDATASNGIRVKFDLAAGTAAAPLALGLGSSLSARITPYGDGYRCEVSCVVDMISTSARMYLYMTDASAATSYNGDGTSSVIAWGAQIEAGFRATSYIPTTTAAVTRAADSAPFILTSSFPFDATQGTLFLEFSMPSVTDSSSIYAGIELEENSSNSLGIRGAAAGTPTVSATAQNAGSSVVSLTGVSPQVAGTIYKCALAYRANDFAFVVNNGAVQTDTSGALPAATKLTMGSYAAFTTTRVPIYLRTAMYVSRRMTNAEIGALTV